MADLDHRTLPRRRGAALHDAILEATLAEIAEKGYAALTMEQVADRAGASKASLYRRWPDVTQLALAAAYHAMPQPAGVPDTGNLRADLLAVLRQVRDQLAGAAGLAIRGVLGAGLRDPAVAAQVRTRSRGNTTAMMREIVTRAQARGECDPAAVSERRLEAGPALLRQRFIFGDGVIDDAYLREVVDEVILPLLMRS
ncbi:TetR/AcrR family transcriptional regulator [Nakamurella sp. GG22]